MDTPVDMDRVVVGVDGSPNSIAALRRAVTEAQRLDATLDVIYVIPGEPGPGAYAGGLRMLSTAMDMVCPAGPGVPVHYEIPHGVPAKTLVRYAEGAELLVIGARAHSQAGNPLGGDVVPVCLNWAPCHLIICADQGSSQQRLHRVTAVPAHGHPG